MTATTFNTTPRTGRSLVSTGRRREVVAGSRVRGTADVTVWL
ncbi:hypothetical protein [Streptomyces sp. CAI-85]|nr:hypothetical protein [Streptomyces sp. CAI-85]